MLPPPTDLYVSPQLYHILLQNGIVIRNVRHKFFTQSLPPPEPGFKAPITERGSFAELFSPLYLRRTLPVRLGARRLPALVYIARRCGTGRARPGYISLVVEAAREWSLPQAYVDTLKRWSPSGWRGARAKDTGEVG